MISLSINIEGDARLALLEEKDLQRRHQGAAGGEENFESLPGERFYKDAATDTLLDMHGDAAIITVEHRGVRLRWKGGSVVPGKGTSSHTGKPTRLLAIVMPPVSRAFEFRSLTRACCPTSSNLAKPSLGYMCILGRRLTFSAC